MPSKKPYKERKGLGAKPDNQAEEKDGKVKKPKTSGKSDIVKTIQSGVQKVKDLISVSNPKDGASTKSKIRIEKDEIDSSYEFVEHEDVSGPQVEVGVAPNADSNQVQTASADRTPNQNEPMTSYNDEFRSLNEAMNLNRTDRNLPNNQTSQSSNLDTNPGSVSNDELKTPEDGQNPERTDQPVDLKNDATTSSNETDQPVDLKHDETTPPNKTDQPKENGTCSMDHGVDPNSNANPNLKPGIENGQESNEGLKSNELDVGKTLSGLAYKQNSDKNSISSTQKQQTQNSNNQNSSAIGNRTSKPEENVEKSNAFKNTGEQLKMPTLKICQRSPNESDIQVTFEVLLHADMIFKDSKVYIVCGPPLSDWKTAMVQMKEHEKQQGMMRYVYLTGVLDLPVSHKCKTIPYKYVVVKPNGEIVWEDIPSQERGAETNRCLVVPDKIKDAFTKFDDAILKKPYPDLHSRARVAATRWMLTHPTELENPDFDFEMAFQRFDEILKAFGHNGMKKCIGDEPKGYLNPTGFSLDETVKNHVNFVWENLQTSRANNSPTLLRKLIFVCLLTTTNYLRINQYKDFQTFFRGFHDCRELLFGESKLPQTFSDETRKVLVDSIKQLVRDFTNLTVEFWTRDLPNTGDWLFAMPFIHKWDQFEDQHWLNLEKWKNQMKTRNFSATKYLDYVTIMKVVDQKIDQDFISMLEPGEMDQLLVNYEYSLTFTPIQLLTMLRAAISTTRNTDKICQNLVIRFKDEFKEIELRASSNNGEQTEEDSKQFLIWASQMINLLRERDFSAVKKHSLVCLFLEIIIGCTPTWRGADVVEEICQSVCISLRPSHRSLLDICKEWSVLLSKISLLDQGLHDQLLNRFQSYLVSVNPEVCWDTLMSGDEKISTEIVDLLLERAVLICQNQGNLASKAISWTVSLLGIDTNAWKRRNVALLFEKYFTNVNFDDSDLMTVIKATTTMPAISNLMRFYPKLLELNAIQGDAKYKANFILGRVYMFSTLINDGSLTLDGFQLVRDEQSQDHLVLLNEVYEKVQNLPKSSQTLRNNIKRRLSELDAYYQAQTDLSDFMKRASSDEDLQKEILSQFSVDPSATQLCSVCCINYDLKKPIVLKLNQVSRVQLETVTKHNDLYSKSYIFRQIQEQVGNSLNSTEDDDLPNYLDDEEENLTTPCDSLLSLARDAIEEFDLFVTELFTLEIRIGEINEKFSNLHKNNRVGEELRILERFSNNKGLAEKVEASIKQFFTLEQHRDAALAIQNASKILGRKKNFTIVENILNTTQGETEFQNRKLIWLSNDLVKAEKVFNNWTADHIDVLQSIEKSQNLLNWLNENIKDRGDLKTFYELASISAGESDHEVDRVLYFYQAVSAYAPLILDLKIDKCSFPEFADACGTVFDALARDDKIAEKLRDSSNRNLEWIKACKEQQGSVEQSSLSLVNKINQTGVFTISVPDRTDESETEKTLDNFIKLTYKKVGDETESLSLEELQELRSKLMLITAGTEGKMDVERFVGILSLVELVCKHFMALLHSGCYLFAQWKIWVFCDPEVKVKVRSDLGNQSGGILLGQNNVENELEQIANFLKKTFEEWSKHVFDLRNSHRSLNFFTTDQLITLSVQLANLVHRNTKMQLKEEMLLRLINPEATRQELEAIIRSQVQQCKMYDVFDESIESGSNDESEASDNEDDNLNPFEKLESSKTYLTLLDDQFDSELILASVIECGTDDLDKATEWCFSHDNKLKEVKDILEAYVLKFKSTTKGNVQLPDKLKKKDEFELAFDVVKDGLLSEQLKQVWEQFLNCVDSLEIKHHLSFLTLAKCLEHLSTNLKRKPDRKFLSTLKEGSPNLIVCSDAEMYATALAIYLNDPKKHMPSLDEVLICHSDTPLEKLELICRRAFSDDAGKIFVIVHAERMNYDKGLYIENLISKTTVENHNYRLVFIASKERNDHSYIVTAFDKDRRQVAALPSSKTIREYLLKHLNTNTSPDPDNLKFRIIKSQMSGNGKSLVAKRLCQQLKRPKTILQLNDPAVNQKKIISNWFKKENSTSGAFHLDLTPSVRSGRDDLIFSLAVLGGLEESGGLVWLGTKNQYYIIELTSVPSVCSNEGDAKNEDLATFEESLPSISCVTPRETFELLQENPTLRDEFLQEEEEGMWTYLFDREEFLSSKFQRPYMYLSLVRNQDQGGILDAYVYDDLPLGFTYLNDCLETLLENCSIQDPTWMELRHFASFLDTQLKSSEKSFFCNPDLVQEEFPRMKTFVVKFLIQMSKDFATRSVEVSDQSHGEGFSKPHIEDRRRWENSPHPYIFFNEDGHSISFFGFKLDGQRNLIDERSGNTLEPSIMTLALYHGLLSNGVQFNKSFDDKNEASKIAELCQVLGVDYTLQNPDQTYELTSDNVMKMLAIFMRFRSNIPVVIMGETGSGKTRLVKYLCDLLREGKNLVNLLILKTHGGVKEENIFAIVNNAIEQARRNKQKGVKLTVLFFDEANTTNAIGAIKSVMCDRLCNGVPIPNDVGLQFVAAVNPFREHSPEMIKKLENAGLGYHIKADKTQDTLGKIPMRRLVYRVKEIPASMFPLIWDFGNLNDETEKKYIIQMIRTCMAKQAIGIPSNVDLVEVLSRSQMFMRSRHDECSFVSLRDVERLLLTLRWFHDQTKIIANKIFQKIHSEDATSQNAILLINMILALGVTYYTRLDERRKDFENEMVKCLNLTNDYFSTVIIACQDLFIDELKLEPNIAKNDALKENVWMMAICIELRIPLFLVGKPGSSKSLAKTVITDVMQGDMSYSKDLFKHFKEIHMVSFQCSPLATAGGILSTFRQCQKFQEKRDLNRFTAVTVLDEIGLAEDSEKMPLKALHPLLEDGCVDLETPEPHKKVSFIGISNWALDPAKMNRGILLSRGVPNQKDLVKSAEGICSRDDDALRLMKGSIEKLAEGYYRVYKQQEREYFGLRDFYSLVKMVNTQVLKKGIEPTEEDIIYAVQRNFGGNFGNFKPAEVFLKTIYPNLDQKKFLPPKTLVTEAIKQEGETRYILLLTKNNAALNIIQEQRLLDMSKIAIIFGSSFIEDQEYRQICLNINRIKIAMELGQTVILCNLNNLYESLYDALNQNYVTMSGSRYVDLGLGTHRVKCRIHPKFRLVLIAEDVEVYEKFPIPLINRLEKHYLGMETMLTEETQTEFVRTLKRWLKETSSVRIPQFKNGIYQQFSPQDVFIGYHEDAPASIVLRLETNPEVTPETLLHKAKSIFLECATPDAISRLSETDLPRDEKEKISQVFYEIPKKSLAEAIKGYCKENHLIQVTTFSRLLTEGAKVEICQELSIDEGSMKIITLQQINTEEQFSKRIKSFLEMSKNDRNNQKILIVQTQINPETPSSLVECSRYSILNEFQSLALKGDLPKFCIVLVLQVPRVHGGFFAGFPGVQWKALHIDEIRGDPNGLDVASWNELTLYEALKTGGNLQQLIEESIPKAASLAYKSDDLTTMRITKCVEIMKNSFSKPDELFIEVICDKVLTSFKLDEPSNRPEKWMADLAMGSVHLKEGNTFAKTIWLHLVDKVSHHLSNILKVCDAFAGLNHVESETAWIRELYLALLKGIGRDTVGGTNKTVGLKFPFSWAIENQLDQLFRKDSNNQNRFEASFNATEQGKTLSTIFVKQPDSSFNLIWDFAELAFGGPMSDESKELVCMEIYNCARHIRIESSKEIDGDDYVIPEVQITATDIYLAVHSLKPRLGVFISIVKLFPDVIKKIEAQNERFNLDIQAIQIALDLNKAPPSDSIFDDACRQDWKSKVTILSTFLAQVEGFVNKNNTSQHDKDLLTSAVKKSKRARIAMLYLDHTINEKTDTAIKEIVCKKLRLLWIGLNELDFTESQKSFDAILSFINTLCINAEDALTTQSNRIRECPLCLETISDPVSLPCGHVGCKSCFKTHFSAASNMPCPMKGCNVIVPDDFTFKSLVDIKKAVQTHTSLRKNLSQFFLDLLQVFIFQGGQTLPHEEIINTLLSLIVSKSLPKDKLKPRTKKVSPFQGDFIDATPVIRSYVLQLLLRYNINSVEKYLDKYLKENEPFGDEQFPELCIILIQCVEDSILVEKVNKVTYASSLKIMRSRLERTDQSTNLVKLLTGVARDRVMMRDLVFALNVYLSGDGETDDATLHDFMKTAIEFVTNHPNKSNLQKYLVRLVVSKYGESFIADWKKQGIFLDLLPHDLMVSTSHEVQDLFLLVHPRYKQTRDIIRVAMVSGDYDELRAFANDNRIDSLVWTLALLHLTQVDPVKVNNVDDFETFLKQHPNILRGRTNNTETCNLFAGKSRRHNSVRSLIVHFEELVANHQMPKFFAIFQQLAASPQNLYETYFPTMPQDESLEAKMAVKDATKWFKCQNGHVYAIGDCGQPRELGKCPTCSLDIGGLQYRFAGTQLNVEQVQQAVVTDETKKRHILGNPNPEERSFMVRDLNGLHVAILRFVLHAAMLVGSKMNPREIVTLCDPQPKDEIQEFLMNHLVLNFTQISNCLGTGENEVVLLLHQVFVSMRTSTHLEGISNMGTKQGVRTWEADFASHFLEPILKKLDEFIGRQRLAVQEDQEESSSVLLEILWEKDRKANTQEKLLELPQLWRPRDNICVENIEAKIGSKKLKDHCPFLSHLLKEQKYLSELGKLPKLIEMSCFLVKTFHRKFEVGEMDQISIRQFLQRQLDTNYFHGHINSFITAFNNLKNDIFAYNWVGRKVQELLGGEDVSMNSACSIIFPSTQGLGLASTLLLQFLIERHNVALRTFNQIKKGEEILTIDCQELLDSSMLVSVDSRDLHLLVVGNSEYNFGLGEAKGQTKWILNEISLEQQCIEKFLSGKPLVNQDTVPRFEHRLESLHASDWNQFNAKIPQATSLPSNAVLFQLESELPEICDISALLDNLQTTVDTLLLVGGNPSDNLVQTIRRLGITTNRLPKSLGQYEQKHIQPLMTQLRFIRAKRMVNNKQLPFHKADKDFLLQLPEELLPSIHELLHHVEPELVACELLDFIHEFIEDNTDAGQENLFDKCLKDYFMAFLDNKDSKHGNDIEKYLTTEIKMKHAISLFRIIASKIQERM